MKAKRVRALLDVELDVHGSGVVLPVRVQSERDGFERRRHVVVQTIWVSRVGRWCGEHPQKSASEKSRDFRGCRLNHAIRSPLQLVRSYCFGGCWYNPMMLPPGS